MLRGSRLSTGTLSASVFFDTRRNPSLKGSARRAIGSVELISASGCRSTIPYYDPKDRGWVGTAVPQKKSRHFLPALFVAGLENLKATGVPEEFDKLQNIFF